MNTVSGVSKDEPRIVNEKGATQSRVLYRFDLLDPSAMFEMTKVLKEGADKYGVDNWRGISVRDHLNHLLIHAYAYLAGDISDDHLSHIMCRAMFAQAVDIDEKREVKMEVKEQTTEDTSFGWSFNIIESIEKKYGPIPADDLSGKIAWVKANVNAVKFGGMDLDGDKHVSNNKTEVILDDDLLGCAMCRSRVLVKREGPQYCKMCGTGHFIKVITVGTETHYHIDPVHDNSVEYNDEVGLRLIKDPMIKMTESALKAYAKLCDGFKITTESLNKTGGFKGGD